MIQFYFLKINTSAKLWDQVNKHIFYLQFLTQKVEALMQCCKLFFSKKTKIDTTQTHDTLTRQLAIPSLTNTMSLKTHCANRCKLLINMQFALSGSYIVCMDPDHWFFTIALREKAINVSMVGSAVNINFSLLNRINKASVPFNILLTIPKN